MNIPHNSLMEKIKELVCLCEQIASDYGDDASWFKQPASDEMISNQENRHNVFIPETYKEWLSFTNEAQIRNSLVMLKKETQNSKGLANFLGAVNVFNNA